MDYTFSPAGGERQLVMQALTIFFFHCPGCPVLSDAHRKVTITQNI